MTIFDRLEAFMAAHAGSSVRLNPPASETQLMVAEAAMGITLPEEIREAYRRHNGVSRLRLHAIPAGVPQGPYLFLPFYDWVDLDRMVEIWKMMCIIDAQMKNSGAWEDVVFDDLEPGRRIRPVDWERRWIPLGSNDTSVFIYVDLAPGPAGVAGQLVDAGHPEGTQYFADSFSSYLERLMDAVDAGALEVDSDGHWRDRAGKMASRPPT